MQYCVSALQCANTLCNISTRYLHAMYVSPEAPVNVSDFCGTVLKATLDAAWDEGPPGESVFGHFGF